MSKMIGQTNYEINQEGYRHIDPLTKEELGKALANFGAWLSYKNKIKYIGILCRDRHDYTVIRLNNFNYDKAIQELREILESRGDIMDIRYMHGQNYYQAWVREHVPDNMADFVKEQWVPQVSMFALFNANEWVIEVD